MLQTHSRLEQIWANGWRKIPASSQYNDVHSIESLGRLLDCKLYKVSLFHPVGIRSQTKFVHVQKNVWKTIATLDESVALLMAEPLDMPLLSFGHRLISSNY
jgi:hypothetical protein